MKDNKVFIAIIGILLFIILGIFIVKSFKVKEYTRNYFYMDTYINVKIYSSSKNKALKALDEIDNIYHTYHDLTDRYNAHEYGLYNLNKNGNSTIDYRLYQIINYGYDWYKKSDGLFNIAIGNVTDVWLKYREKGSGVPTKEELVKKSINISDVIINEVITNVSNPKVDSIKLNNGVKIDLGAIAKGYTTDVVADYLKSKGIKKYIINAGGNVLVGKKAKESGYKIGIENPTGEGGIYKIVKGEDIAIVTSGGYNRNYTYDGVTYNHIINPKTLYPANNMLSVTVIAKSSKEADALSTTLFLMDVDKGMEFIKEYDADAIWYLNDGKVITTPGIAKYE